MRPLASALRLIVSRRIAYRVRRECNSYRSEVPPVVGSCRIEAAPQNPREGSVQ